MEPWRRLDESGDEDARALLATCCGARRWVERMNARRPFRDRDTLLAAARDEWLALEPADWLEAFTHHPRIGDRDALERRFAATAQLSGQEQAGINTAGADVLDALAAGNRAYEDRFGFIFIVCATGKRAEEMLGLLQARLENDRRTELRIAAEEQAKITEIRLLGLGARR